jgi:uncharacterized protein (DUF2147 family)
MKTKISNKIFALWILLLICIGMIASLTSMTTTADEIVGRWQSIDKDYTWEFFKSGDTYSAKLITSTDALEADGRTFKKDVNNPDVKLKDRSLQGIIFITGLKYDDGEYVDGTIYAFGGGSSYDCKATVEGNKLSLRAYKGISILGKTIEFDRMK